MPSSAVVYIGLQTLPPEKLEKYKMVLSNL